MGRIEQPRLGDVDEIVEKNIEKDRKVTCFLNGGLIVWHQFWEGLEGKKAAQDTDLDYWAVPSLGFHPKRNESGPIPDGCVRRALGPVIISVIILSAENYYVKVHSRGSTPQRLWTAER